MLQFKDILLEIELRFWIVQKDNFSRTQSMFKTSFWQAWAYLNLVRVYFGYAYLLKWNTLMHILEDLKVCVRICMGTYTYNDQ